MSAIPELSDALHTAGKTDDEISSLVKRLFAEAFRGAADIIAPPCSDGCTNSHADCQCGAVLRATAREMEDPNSPVYGT